MNHQPNQGAEAMRMLNARPDPWRIGRHDAASWYLPSNRP